MNTTISNPYIGPRPFKKAEAMRFFGREREARDLLALVTSQRMVLFYASSGAGKSSLINARLIDGLAGRGFEVLPVGRVSGVLPRAAGVDAAGTNVFSYFLKQSLAAYNPDTAQTETSQQLFQEYAHVSLSEFLLRLANAGKDENGNDRYVYTAPGTATEMPTVTDSENAEVVLRPRALIIDQFEEIFTTNLQAWEQRGSFFAQIRQAMDEDPFLWVVLVMREDYIANLDPLAHLLPGELRARYYMQRMGQHAALEAVMKPVEIKDDEYPEWYRPFVPQTAERLVNNLRRVHAPAEQQVGGTLATGEFVEPVQLQVVCYQLWEQLRDIPGTEIADEDLDRLAGGEDLSIFVDRALGEFYEQALRRVVEKAGGLVSEMDLRRWFSERLITEAGTRGFVYRGETETGGLPNEVVQLIAAEFLIRSESRAGGTWYELAHDRFVDPIIDANSQWNQKRRRAQPWIDAAYRWYESGNSRETRTGTLLEGDALAAVLAETQGHHLEPAIEEYLAVSQAAQEKRDQDAALNTQRKRVLTLAALAGSVFIGLVILAFVAYGWNGDRTKLAAQTKELSDTNSRLITKTQELSGTNNLLLVQTQELSTTNAMLLRAEAIANNAQKELESVTLSRIISRLNLKSEDQRQFALLLSMHAMEISPTLAAESASVEALDAAYRNSDQWQPVTTPTLMFTQSLPLPFTNPLTMTLSRDGSTVAAVEAGSVVTIARAAPGWVTDTVPTNFARITALALSDDGRRIAVAGCGQKTDVASPKNPQMPPTPSPQPGDEPRECGNWRIEILPTGRDSQFRRVVTDGVKSRVVAVDFHPKLMHLVAATADNSLLYWRFSATEPAAQPVTHNILRDLVDVSVSPDGMYLAALDQQGRNRVWSWNTWGAPEDNWPPDLKDNSYRSVTFLHSGEWLVTGSDCPNAKDHDGPPDPCPAVRLWDKKTLVPIGPPLVVGENILDVGFDERTDTLTVLGSHRMVRWDLNNEDWLALSCQRAGRDMTYDEWKEAFPNEDIATYENICRFPLHPSFVSARIAQASLKLDDCSSIGTQDGLKLLNYEDIDPPTEAVSILLKLALDRFEPDEGSQNVTSNDPAANCLEQANDLRKREGLSEIPQDEAMVTASRLLDAESRLTSDPARATRDLDEVRRQLTAWSVDLDSRLAADYQMMCFDQAYMDACDAARATGLDALIGYGDVTEGEISQNTEGTPWYFWGRRGEAVTIAMEAVGDSFDTLLILDGAGGKSELAQNDDYVGDSYNSRITDFVLPYGGLYRIRPRAFSGQGTFRLALRKRDLPEIDFGVPVTSNATESGSWTFDGKAGQTVMLDLVSTGNGYGLHLALKPAGEDWPIAESYDGDRIDPLVLPSDDMYVVTVDGVSESSPFSLTVSLLEPQVLAFDVPKVATTEVGEMSVLTGTVGQVINITLESGDPNLGIPKLALLDAGGRQLTSSTEANSDTRTDRGFILPEAGPYFVYVSPLETGSFYTVTATSVNVPTLTVSSPVTSRVNAVSLWKTNLNAGEPVEINLVSSDGQSVPLLDLLSSNGSWLSGGVSQDDETRTSIAGFVPTKSGQYFVRVGADSNDTAYTLTVNAIAPSELPVNQPQTSHTDTDMLWRFEGSAGQVVGIALTTSNADFDPQVWLYDAKGQEVGNDDDNGPGSNAYLLTALPADGMYLVRTGAYRGRGQYQVALTDLMTDTTSLPANVSVRIEQGHVWHVDGQSGQVLSIDIVEDAEFSYSTLQIVTTEGQLVAASDDYSGLVAILPRSGRYLIVPHVDSDYAGSSMTAKLTDASGMTDIDNTASQTLYTLAANNAIDLAIDLYNWGTSVQDVMFFADARNSLCSFGASRGEADKVIDICETLLVEPHTTDSWVLAGYHGSRGLARALTGNAEGAAEDFDYYAANGGHYPEQRREWARRLRAGEPASDVFDEATLQNVLLQ